MSKSVFIKTYGCQMNVYDSQRMADVLAPFGYRETKNVADADLAILNTCHIREHAEEKVFSELGRWRRVKSEKAEKGETMLIAVAGCVAQAESEILIARAPYVDIVLGPQTYHRLPEMLSRLSVGEGRRVLDIEFPAIAKFDFLPEATSRGLSAFLAVQEGCDKFCAYCVVPYTRGQEYSRPVQAIIEEAKQLIAGGVSEITLLGQNVNGFHGVGADGKKWSLARLIEALAEIPDLLRIRYTTSHPKDMDDALIAAHRDISKLMPFLHLPVQSGSDLILKQMNRRHTAQHYLDIVEKLRAARPDLALSSDFIVGFPGESEQDFQDTLDLVEKVGFAQAYSFKYSPRPGTPAAILEQQIPEDIKEERLARLQKAIGVSQYRFNQTCLGKSFDVLLERPGRRSGQLIGRSPYMQSVYVEAPSSMMNSMQRLVVTEAHANSLAAHLAGESAA